jgi:hypothetical protein
LTSNSDEKPEKFKSQRNSKAREIQKPEKFKSQRNSKASEIQMAMAI